jgi:hypothetical protein
MVPVVEICGKRKQRCVSVVNVLCANSVECVDAGEMCQQLTEVSVLYRSKEDFKVVSMLVELLSS